MSFSQGCNLRNTLGFVVDGTNYTFGNVSYPTVLSPSGINGGFESGPDFARDRSTGVDTRLAGLSAENAGDSGTFRMDLPGTGSYGIQAAFGDAAYSAGPMTAQFEDTTTIFATPVTASSTSGGGHFFAANGTQETSAANWATNNPAAGGGTDEITNTFSTTIFRTKVTSTAGGNSAFASVFIRSTGGAASRGLFMQPTMTGLGAGGSFFPTQIG